MSREEEGCEETGGELSVSGSERNDEGWMGVGLEWPGYLGMEAEIGDSLPPDHHHLPPGVVGADHPAP